MADSAREELAEHLAATYDETIDLAAELEVWEAGDERPPEQRFSIENDSMAEWALRKLRRLNAQLAEARGVAEQERRAIAEWLARKEQAASAQVAFFEELLAEFHKSRLAEDPKAKTITLPAGELRARKTPDKAEVEDAQTFVAWYEGDEELRRLLPDLVRVKKEPALSAIKQAFGDSAREGRFIDARTGELVPGIRHVAGSVRFAIEVAP